MADRSASEITKAPRRPRGAVRGGLIAAGLELARTGGPDAVVLREATRMVGVVPNAAYRHFADRDELRAAVDELADAGVLDRRRRDGIEYPIWAMVHGLAVLTGQGPLRDVPDGTRHHLEKLTSTFIEQGLA